MSLQDAPGLEAPGPAPIRTRPVGQTQKKRLPEMSTRERLGMAGLIAKLDADAPDYSPLSVGHDLSELGFDMNRPPYEALLLVLFDQLTLL